MGVTVSLGRCTDAGWSQCSVVVLSAFLGVEAGVLGPTGACAIRVGWGRFELPTSSV